MLRRLPALSILATVSLFSACGGGSGSGSDDSTTPFDVNDENMLSDKELSFDQGSDENESNNGEDSDDRDGSTTVSSKTQLIGDPKRGRRIFRSAKIGDGRGACGTCHIVNEKTGNFTYGVYDGVNFVSDTFSVNDFKYPEDNSYSQSYTGKNQSDLAQFIEHEMPLNSNLFGTCTDQCAEDVAAYIWSLRDDYREVEKVITDDELEDDIALLDIDNNESEDEEMDDSDDSNEDNFDGSKDESNDEGTEEDNSVENNNEEQSTDNVEEDSTSNQEETSNDDPMSEEEVVVDSLPQTFFAECEFCHGSDGNGGAFNKDLGNFDGDLDAFANIIRKGEGVMPAYTSDDLSDDDLIQIYNYYF